MHLTGGLNLIANTTRILPPNPEPTDDNILKQLNTAEWVNYAGRPDIALDTAFDALHSMWGIKNSAFFTYGINHNFTIVIDLNNLNNLTSQNLIRQIHFPKRADYAMIKAPLLSIFSQKVVSKKKHHKTEVYHLAVHKVSRKVAYQTIEFIKEAYLENDTPASVTDTQVVNGFAKFNG